MSATALPEETVPETPEPQPGDSGVPPARSPDDTKARDQRALRELMERLAELGFTEGDNPFD